VRFQRAYGLADRTWDLPTTLDTRFEIGSLSKAFTAMAIAQLAAAGKLGLDDPIGKYYARAPETWKTVTTHQLLTHTSGIAGNDVKDYSKGITVPYRLDELIETFRDRPLSFEPGSGWQYTNTEYVLLAYVIEKVSGESYAGYLSRHIFDPLKMRDTGLAATNAVVRHQAEGYTPENGVLRRRDYFDRSLETGAGGLHSTLADLARWDQALYTEQLVPKAYLERVVTGNNKGKYGYGWFVKDDGGGRRIYHGGSEPGYSAFLLRRPEQHRLVVVLSNIDQAPVRDIAEGLEKLAAGE